MKLNDTSRMQVKKSILTTLLIMLCGLGAQAKYFGFKIGGEPVTSSNCNNVTGSNISGTVTYDESTNTVTLKNVTITRTVSDGRCIFNEENEGLIVELKGTNNLTSKVCAPVKLQKNTTFIATAGSVTNMKGLESDANAIYVPNVRSMIYFKGTGTINMESGNDAAFYGETDSGYKPQAFFEGANVTIKGTKGDLVNITTTFNYTDDSGNSPKGKVTLYATNNSGKANVINSPITLSGTPKAAILEPWGATVSGSTIKLNSSNVYNEDIVISSDYVALLTSQYFPDTNFRNYLLNRYPKHYITDSDVTSCISLNLSDMSIASIEGIKYFTNLTTLKFNNNPNLTKADLTNNTKIYRLECSGCALTTLSIRELDQLVTLDCSNNRLNYIDLTTSLKLETLNCSNNLFSFLNTSFNDKLKSYNCSNNAFESLRLDYYANLQTLNCSNNPVLKSLECTHCALTSLDVSGCSMLKTILCGYNQFTSLNISDLASLETLNCTANRSLKTLTCNNNGLKDLNTTECTALTTITCQNNRFNSLFVNNLPSLTTLDCKNNTALETLNCKYNALTTLIVNGCIALKQLYGGGNKFTHFNISYFNNLHKVDFSNNMSLTFMGCSSNPQLTEVNVSGCTKLEEMDCSSNQFLASLDVSGLTNLYYLNCPYNISCSSLNLSGCTNLKVLICPNNNLTELDVAGFTDLYYLNCGNNSLTSTSLILTGCTNLRELYCHYNSFTSLNLSDFPSLSHLWCNHNSISSLNLSECKYLSELQCQENSLSSLILSRHPYLQTLYCHNNKLTSLDLTDCAELIELKCQNNQLTSLTLPVSYNLLLSQVLCYSNRLQGAAMNKLFNALPPLVDINLIGNIYAINLGDPNEQNVVTTANVNTAVNNGWRVYYSMDGNTWQCNYPGTYTPTPTDINPQFATPDASLSTTESPVYNLSGQRVKDSYKGIVIRNGHKVKQ